MCSSADRTTAVAAPALGASTVAVSSPVVTVPFFKARPLAPLDQKPAAWSVIQRPFTPSLHSPSPPSSVDMTPSTLTRQRLSLALLRPIIRWYPCLSGRTGTVDIRGYQPA